MLTSADVDRFHHEGYLVIDNIVDETALAAVRQEYVDLMDRLYAGWHKQGLVDTPPVGLSFWEKPGALLSERLRLVSAHGHQPPPKRHRR